MTNRIRVGVIRGGPSAEYEVSLNTGATILSALREKLDERYDPVDVFIDRDGRWHIFGKEVVPEESGRHFDIAWNALHGAYGEDGKIQSLMEAHGIPFTGSGSLSSALGMNKILTKKILKDAGIKSPYWKEIASDVVMADPATAAHELFTTFLFPAVIKPSQSGSSIGVSIVKAKNEIASALLEAAKHGDTILVEEFISGTEVTCGVIEGFRGKDLYALPVVEIKANDGFYDYKAKYESENTGYVCPSNLPKEVKDEIENIAMKAHGILGLKDFSRSDFIVHPKRGVYFLEVNTLPGMTTHSLIPKALRAVGSDIHEFIDHIIKIELGV